ncbi:MAG: fluoride efflux transporter CrcB [Bacteroidales bacterium]|nr:fluoride efflux transporter CrcB [Bacteroidales bacterium]
MRELLLVFLGGGLGSMLRYGIKLMQNHLALNPLSTLGQTVFPWPTMVANVLGCLFIGIFYSVSGRTSMSPEMRLFLTTGLCGGFTTFSTFSSEGIDLLRTGHLGLFAAYILLTLLLGLGAVLLGAWLGGK